MPRYIFDVHDDGIAEWGEKALEGAGRGEIESRVLELIVEAQARQVVRAEGKSLITVFVYHENDEIVLTAFGRPGRDVEMVWKTSD